VCRNPRELLGEFKTGLQALYGDRLKGVYLYGSYARGDHDDESDFDVLVVLDDFGSYAGEIDRTSELVSNLSLQQDVSVSRVFVRQRDWLAGTTPFVVTVRAEAVAA